MRQWINWALYGRHRWGNHDWQIWWPDWWRPWHYHYNVYLSETYARERIIVESFVRCWWVIQVAWMKARKY